MLEFLSWFVANYTQLGWSALVFVATVLLGVATSTLQRPGVFTRWVDRVAAWTCVALGVLAVFVVIAKLWQPTRMLPMPWIAPAACAGLGLLLGAASAVLARYKRIRAWKDVRPVVESLKQHLERVEHDLGWDRERYVELSTDDGVAVPDALVRTSGNLALVGPPGVGKTVALVETAGRCFDAPPRRRGRWVIPVYVDLSGLGCQAASGSFLDYVERSVFRSSAVRTHFADALADRGAGVEWLLLLDNVDQCPISHVDQGGLGHRDWLAEITGFLDVDASHVRGVVAGRELAVSIDGVRGVAMSPLSGRTYEKFYASLGVAPAAATALMAEPTFAESARNPGWAALVSPYVRAHAVPAHRTAHELMSAVIDDIVHNGTDDETVDGHELRLAAETIAVSMITGDASQNALKVTRIADATLGPEGSSASTALDLAVDVLVRCGLGVYRRAPDGRQVFEFRHRSVGACLATHWLLHNPWPVSPSTMVLDARCGAVAMAILQVGDAVQVQQLVEAAEEVFRAADKASADPAHFVRNLVTVLDPESKESGVPKPIFIGVQPDVRYLLQLLEAGLRRRQGLIPEELRRRVDELIGRAFADDAVQAKAQALEALSLASPRVAAAALVRALRSDEGWLVEIATEQLAGRPELIAHLQPVDQMRLTAATSLGAGRRGTVLHPTGTTAKTTPFATVIGPVVAGAISLLLTLPLIVDAIRHSPSDPVSWFLPSSIAAASALLITAIRSHHGSKLQRHLLRRGAVRLINTYRAMAILAAVILLGTAVDLLTGNGLHVIAVLRIFAYVWPLAALYYLTIDPQPQWSRFGFPFSTIARPVITAARHELHEFLPLTLPFRKAPPTVTRPTRYPRNWTTVLFGWLCLGFAIATLVVLQNPLHIAAVDGSVNQAIATTAPWITGTLAVICGITWRLIDYVRDQRWLRVWCPIGQIQSADMFGWISSLRTRRATIQFLTLAGRRANPTSPAMVTWLHDFYHTLEWVRQLTPKLGTDNRRLPLGHEVWATAPIFDTPDFRNWLETYDQRFPARLESLAKSCRSELAEHMVSIRWAAG